MSYEIEAKQPPLRAPAMLDRNPVPTDQAGVFGKAPYDEVAPGLYPDETVYRLDTGEKIALSVRSKREPLGAGMKFRGWARVIEGDGSTMRDKAGEEMELSFSWPCDAGMFDRLDEPGNPAEVRISREIMLLMLGEPPTMIPVHVDLDAPVPEIATDNADWERHPLKAPPGTVLDPGATEAPMIGWATEMKLNASIRHALKLFDRAEPMIDVAGLLETA